MRAMSVAEAPLCTDPAMLGENSVPAGLAKAKPFAQDSIFGDRHGPARSSLVIALTLTYPATIVPRNGARLGAR